MKQALGDLTKEMCLLYVDDICIYSEIEDHIDSVTAVFKRVLANGAKLKISKCAFGYTRVECLSHEVVAGKGVAVREAKVKAIVQCDRPQTAKDIKTFLGMSGFFRKFIPNYAEIASPLRALEKQVRTTTTPITYEWQKKRQRCFDAIKAALVNADTLATPDYNKPFLLLIDASYRFLGAALVQIDDGGQARPIAYASTALVDAQKKYVITDLEGLALVWFGARDYGGTYCWAARERWCSLTMQPSSVSHQRKIYKVPDWLDTHWIFRS